MQRLISSALSKPTLWARQSTRLLNTDINPTSQPTTGDIYAQDMLDEIYESIRAQRFEDIVVIQTRFDADPRYLILANAFNPRHLSSGTEMINKNYKSTIKLDTEEFARLSISPEWNVIDLKAVVVHLFSREARKQFDIDQLWAVGERFDDLINIPEEEQPYQFDTIDKLVR